MRLSPSPLLFLLGACGVPTAPEAVPDPDGALLPVIQLDASSPKSWAGAGAFGFVFSEYREAQGFSDCEVHYSLRWVEDPDVPCDGCSRAGAVEVRVVDDPCPWEDWAAVLEPEPHRYAVHPDTEELFYFDGDVLTDARDLGWEVEWGEGTVHLLGMSTDHTYYATERRTLSWGG